MMFSVISDQKDFVPQTKIMQCDTVLGKLNRQLLGHLLGQRGPSAVRLCRTTSTTAKQVSEMSHDFNFFLKCHLVETLKSAAHLDVCWCDSLFIKKAKVILSFGHNHMWIQVALLQLACCQHANVYLLASRLAQMQKT